MGIIRNGSRSPQVKLAQRLINLRVSPQPRLKEDSLFGNKTAAVRQFQITKRLSVDGLLSTIPGHLDSVKLEARYMVIKLERTDGYGIYPTKMIMQFPFDSAPIISQKII